MIDKPWGAITKREIEYLVDNAVPESHTLDYKQELPNESPRSKLDFLTDIAALANAAGGDLIYGIKEKKIEGRPTAIPDGYSDLGVDSLSWEGRRRRLESWVLTDIEPRLSVKMDLIDGLPKGAVVLVRVPPSWNAPHMITAYTKDHLRPQFHKRHNGGNHPMDISEIRAAFTGSETLIGRLRAFCEGRSKLIESRDPCIPSVGGDWAISVLHLSPIRAFAPNALLDISGIGYWEWNARCPLQRASGHLNCHFNFEGFLISDTAWSSTPALGYVQVFRNGIIEMVQAVNDDLRYVPDTFERGVVKAARKCLTIQKELGVEPTIFATLRILRIRGYPLVLPRTALSENQEGFARDSQNLRHFDKDSLCLPECVIQDFDDGVPEAFRTAFDVIYQSAGMSRSYNYDGSQKWIGGSLE